jgi:hypothetical protein
VLIDGDTIIAAGVILPLTQFPVADKSLGTRHRAALGLSEETDALVIVVSEETSQISLATAAGSRATSRWTRCGPRWRAERSTLCDGRRQVRRATLTLAQNAEYIFAYSQAFSVLPFSLLPGAFLGRDRRWRYYNLLTHVLRRRRVDVPLLLCSLFALGVIIAKAYTLWAAHRQSAAVLEEVEALARGGKLDEAIRVAADTPGPVAAILYTGLRRVRDRQSGADIEKAVQTTGVIELGFLERGLAVLATISNVAPLLGFLGTVAGMISAFGAIAEAGQVEASLVAAASRSPSSRRRPA